MADAPAPPAPQPLVGYLGNEEWGGLLAEVNALVERMDALPDSAVRDDVFRLLDGIDAIHREALRRLVRLFKEGVLEQVVTDPAIHTLMELYDLLPAAPTPQAAPAAPRRFPTIPIRAAAPPPRARYPHWVPVLGRADDLPSGATCAVQADETSLLLARRDDRLYAMAARCAVDGAPLAGATLNGYTLTCPRHAGCHYDVRTGQRLGGGPALACHPVRVGDDGRVLAGLDMDFQPDVPSF